MFFFYCRITNKELRHPQKLYEDWNPDTGYSRRAVRKTYPRRSQGVGKDGGLYVEMTELAADIDYLCSEWGASGYKVHETTLEKTAVAANTL